MKKFSWGKFFGTAAIVLFYGMFCFITYFLADNVALRNNTAHEEFWFVSSDNFTFYNISSIFINIVW